MPDRSCLLQDLADLENEAVAAACEAHCRSAASTLPDNLLRRQPLQNLRLCLQHCRSVNDSTSSLCSGVRLGHILVFLAGLVSGWSTAVVVLFYDGSVPVNILHAIVVLALIPLLLSLPFYIGLLIPAQQLLGVFKLLTPGRWTLDLWQHLQTRRQVAGAGFAIPLPVGHRLAVWWTQLFSLGFAIGSLLELFYQISIFDLAFAWSTTLNLSADQFRQITSILAWPWSGLMPDAVPTAALIEVSQYFRLQGNTTPIPDSAALMTQWWPFLLASVTCYSLLPRLVSAMIAGWRLRRCLQQQVLHSGTARRLLQLLDNTSVSTRSPVVEVAPQAQEGGFSPIPDVSQLADSCHNTVVINWSEAADFAPSILEQFLQQRNLTVLGEFAAGGQVALAREQQIPANIQALVSDLVWLRVKAWEPPLQEHQHFLRQLRETIGESLPLLVTLIGLPDCNNQQDRQIWEQALGRLQDPAIYCQSVIGQLP